MNILEVQNNPKLKDKITILRNNSVVMLDMILRNNTTDKQEYLEEEAYLLSHKITTCNLLLEILDGDL